MRHAMHHLILTALGLSLYVPAELARVIVVWSDTRGWPEWAWAEFTLIAIGAVGTVVAWGWLLVLWRKEGRA